MTFTVVSFTSYESNIICSFSFGVSCPQFPFSSFGFHGGLAGPIIQILFIWSGTPCVLLHFIFHLPHIVFFYKIFIFPPILLFCLFLRSYIDWHHPARFSFSLLVTLSGNLLMSPPCFNAPLAGFPALLHSTLDVAHRLLVPCFYPLVHHHYLSPDPIRSGKTHFDYPSCFETGMALG